MAARIQLVSILAAILLLFVVFELVRRRRLMERYALLWLLSAVVLLGLASWPDALQKVSRLVGIFYPPTALFFVAFGFVLLLLLHFSTAVSRLSDQTKVLAQRLALLEERVKRRELEGQEERAGVISDDAISELEERRSGTEPRRVTHVTSD
jgi:hypothetical protein